MLRVLSLFSGIGAFEKALKRCGIDHEVLAYCEIDPHASKAYSIIHGIPESKNLRDVTNVDILDIDETVDLITYGFPCQDISIAGKQKGFTDEDGKRTRSGLFFEALRIIDDYRPKFAIAENVKALTAAKFSQEFKIVIESLEEIGYNNYYAVLNAKDYAIPQSRERVFIVSIRKDIDRGFIFPEGRPIKKSMSDCLDGIVEDKYYLDDEKARVFLKSLIPEYVMRTPGGVKQIGNLFLRASRNNPSEGRVYDKTGLAPTLRTMQGGNQQPWIIDGDRIRKVTPLECWRLMGFNDEDFVKVKIVISNAQLYKQAGNSIVVNVLEAIFTKLGEIYEEFRV